jgi:hypothetical protein
MRRFLLAGVVLAAMLVPASSASAALTGEWARFSKCPTANPEVNTCVYAETTKGLVTTGKKTVPIVNKVVLQGGVNFKGDYAENLSLVGASNGETLTKSPQPVPGGLLGVTAPTWWPGFLQDLFNDTINDGFTGVQSTVELAGPPSAVKLNILATAGAQGTALTMPVKIKLSNPFLGNNCYIGSNSNPIIWKFTTGTTSPPPPNTPITGSPGHSEGREEGSIIVIKDNKLVDNSFAVPGANGCGGILLSWAVDPFVNSIVGIPAPAGSNTAILEGSTFLGDANRVREMQ